MHTSGARLRARERMRFGATHSKRMWQASEQFDLASSNIQARNTQNYSTPKLLLGCSFSFENTFCRAAVQRASVTLAPDCRAFFTRKKKNERESEREEKSARAHVLVCVLGRRFLARTPRCLHVYQISHQSAVQSASVSVLNYDSAALTQNGHRKSAS